LDVPLEVPLDVPLDVPFDAAARPFDVPCRQEEGLDATQLLTPTPTAPPSSAPHLRQPEGKSMEEWEAAFFEAAAARDAVLYDAGALDGEPGMEGALESFLGSEDALSEADAELKRLASEAADGAAEAEARGSAAAQVAIDSDGAARGAARAAEAAAAEARSLRAAAETLRTLRAEDLARARLEELRATAAAAEAAAEAAVAELDAFAAKRGEFTPEGAPGSRGSGGLGLCGGRGADRLPRAWLRPRRCASAGQPHHRLLPLSPPYPLSPSCLPQSVPPSRCGLGL
jgi:hypothetical protein